MDFLKSLSILITTTCLFDKEKIFVISDQAMLPWTIALWSFLLLWVLKMRHIIQWSYEYNIVLFSFNDLCAHGSSNCLYTWRFSRTDCKEVRLPPNGSLQCGSLCDGPCPPFHTLCKRKLFGVHWNNCSDFSPSTTSPFLQAPQGLQRSLKRVQLCCLFLL